MEISRPEQSWYALPINGLYTHFNVQRDVGLNQETVDFRLKQFGPNRLREAKQETLLRVFLEEIREPMILLLLVTGLLYSVWGNLADALTIFFVILVLVSVEVINEYRAKRAIAGLSKLSEPTASVHRDGQDIEVPVEDIVPGDIILLRAGRRVPADARLIESYSLAANESSLTGESVPVEKDAHLVLPENTALAEQQNTIFAGTSITRGLGSALVVTTGMQTELGHVAGLAQEIRQPRTPLQQAMRELTRWLVWLALGFSVLIPLLAILLSGEPWRQMLLTGLSLAFAVIPEELPIIITMVLALGAYRLARQQAIIKRLQAVETLGSVTTIATDKTGTLTENRMQVSRFYPEALEHKLLEIGVLSHKLRIVRALREQGERVAVTGDGINDAPALAAADIGVAMGETGTDVAREAADMVLANDNFTTIVNAIKEGRILFANLKKGVRYYLACKVALVAATLLPVLLHVPVPFAPIQIILMELFMDLAASATFVNEPAEADLMRYPPRNPRASFMDRAMVSSIFSSAAGLFMAVTTTYLVTWYTSGDLVKAQTVAFITWLLGHILLAVNLRTEREPLFRLGFFSNRLMIIWGVATLIFIIFATFIPGIQNLLKTVNLTPGEWILVIGMAFVGTFWIEGLKLLRWRNKSNKHN